MYVVFGEIDNSAYLKGEDTGGTERIYYYIIF